MTPEEAYEECLCKCINALQKHFDCVQIFASKLLVGEEVKEYFERHSDEIDDSEDPDDEQTLSYSKGSGNFNARIGQVSTWLDNR